MERRGRERQDRPQRVLGELPDRDVHVLHHQGTADQQEATAAEYGIFSSNSRGPAGWNQLYASNFNDSGMYVGACHRQCDVTIDHAWMEYNALGYSGTNSGGAVVIEYSAVRQ